MIDTGDGPISRRQFLGSTTQLAGASALAMTAIPHVHAAQDSTVRLALIGCGGRGTGAAGDALATTSGPIRLHAMADVFGDRLNSSYDNLKKGGGEKIDVPPDRRFIGLDAYKKAMDTLKPGDIAIFATPPAFRWVHFSYAIEKGLNVFMEKPISVDGASARKMFALGEESVRRGLKVGVGLMCRHCESRSALFNRIKDGQIGDIVSLRAYRMHDLVGFFDSPRKPAGTNEFMYQIQRFHSFLWASGGAYSDFYIHHIDECCWMKDAWPVEAQASGGRHYRGDSVDQNFDNYSVEYTFADGVKMFLYGRCMPGCHNEFAAYAHGSKGLGVISEASHTPARSRIYRGQGKVRANLLWSFPEEEPNPYKLEWEHLVKAVRDDKPYNEVKRGNEASLATFMGRLAAHTGQIIKYDQALNHEIDLAPGLGTLSAESPAPLQALPDGKYPIPRPGLTGLREF